MGVASYILGTFYYASYLWTMFAVILSTLVALCCLPNKWAVAFLAVLWATDLIPLEGPMSWFGRHYSRLSVRAACVRHSVKATYEDSTALRAGRPYVVGYEPHSSLPYAVQTVFCDHSPLKPPGLKHICILGTTAGFYLPLVRHIWWWMGGCSAGRHSMKAALARGDTVVLVPGGVQECAHMAPGKEVAFLTSRTGFVRIALQHGAPLVPVFCFGQTAMLSWARLGPPLVPKALMLRIARIVGFLPMVLWGTWGTTLTHPVPVHMVIGRPIEVPTVADPSQQQIQEYLDKFIEGLQRIFEAHKAMAGHPDLQLHVI